MQFFSFWLIFLVECGVQKTAQAFKETENALQRHTVHASLIMPPGQDAEFSARCARSRALVVRLDHHGQIHMRRIDGWRDLKRVLPLKAARWGDAQTLADLRSFVIRQL